MWFLVHNSTQILLKRTWTGRHDIFHAALVFRVSAGNFLQECTKESLNPGEKTSTVDNTTRVSNTTRRGADK